MLIRESVNDDTHIAYMHSVLAKIIEIYAKKGDVVKNNMVSSRSKHHAQYIRMIYNIIVFQRHQPHVVEPTVT